jgi:hypothetical protein
MMASLIFAVSVVTLLMFFVTYCRSLTAASAQLELSPEVRDVTGIEAVPCGRDFARVRQLLQLCPERTEDKAGLQAVELYFNILHVVQGVARSVPALQAWTEHELAGCASFAVAVLDRRIASSREILARQSEL